MNLIYEDNRIYAEREDGLLLADESLRGQGVASDLMLEAYNFIKAKNLKIVAKCPYAINWFKKHEDFQDIVINVKTKK